MSRSAQLRYVLLICTILSFPCCSNPNNLDQDTSAAPWAASKTSSETSAPIYPSRVNSPAPSNIMFVPPANFSEQSEFPSEPSAASPAPSIASAAPIVMSSVPAEDLFGSREVAFSSNLSVFQRWLNLNTKFSGQREALISSCDGNDSKRCPLQWWHQFIAEIKRLPLRERVIRVNDTFNRVAYVTAVQNWNNPGYWETPFEFLAHGGQCQDYAIAKYLALLESGVPEDKLRFVVLRVTSRGIDHAVTVVSVDDEDLVLDNLDLDIKPAKQVRNYAPYYALNDRGWWMFAPPSTGLRREQIATSPNRVD
jgi:predicted transglutaminase-like cysteine proteinase